MRVLACFDPSWPSLKDIKRRDLEAKLEQCLRLASQFPEGVTAQNLRELAAELQQKIRALGE